MPDDTRDPTHDMDFPGWRVLEDVGAGTGAQTPCERCGRPGTPRQQFEHMGVTVCFVCTRGRADELLSERNWS